MRSVSATHHQASTTVVAGWWVNVAPHSAPATTAGGTPPVSGAGRAVHVFHRGDEVPTADVYLANARPSGTAIERYCAMTLAGGLRIHLGCSATKFSTTSNCFKKPSSSHYATPTFDNTSVICICLIIVRSRESSASAASRLERSRSNWLRALCNSVCINITSRAICPLGISLASLAISSLVSRGKLGAKLTALLLPVPSSMLLPGPPVRAGELGVGRHDFVLLTTTGFLSLASNSSYNDDTGSSASSGSLTGSRRRVKLLSATIEPIDSRRMLHPHRERAESTSADDAANSLADSWTMWLDISSPILQHQTGINMIQGLLKCGRVQRRTATEHAAMAQPSRCERTQENICLSGFEMHTVAPQATSKCLRTTLWHNVYW